MPQDSAFSFDLEKFDGEFKPAPGRITLDQLADGNYLMEVESARLKQTKPQGGETILEANYLVLEGPSLAESVVQRAYFFRTQEAVDMLGKDLLTMGFDTDRWDTANGRPFSKEITKAVSRMKGIRFLGTMKTTEKESIDKAGKTKKSVFHNLYINKLVEGHGPSANPVEDDPFGFPPKDGASAAAVPAAAPETPF